MSLPSRMKFFKGDEEVLDMFVNIGLVFIEDAIPSSIVQSMNYHNEYAEDDEKVDWSELDFDTIHLYGRIVKYEEMKKWYNDEITLEELVETFEVKE